MTGLYFALIQGGILKKISVKINVWDANGTHVINFSNSDHAPQPDPPASNWIWRQKLNDGLFLVEVKLENNLAYQGEILLGDTLF